jgi:hypothetical protein
VAPSARTASTLICGVVTGMAMTASHPSFFAASATPCAEGCHSLPGVLDWGYMEHTRLSSKLNDTCFDLQNNAVTSAHPTCAWFPADEQITPRFSASGEICTMRLYAPGCRAVHVAPVKQRLETSFSALDGFSGKKPGGAMVNCIQRVHSPHLAA